MAELSVFRCLDEVTGAGEGVEVRRDQRVVVQAGEERPEHREQNHQKQQGKAGRRHEPPEPLVTAVGQRDDWSVANLAHARALAAVTGPRPATAMRARASRSNRSLQLAVLLGELNELLLDLRERILRRLLAGNRQAQL